MSVDWEAIDGAVFDWVTAKLTHLDPETQFQWKDQNLPQPSYPFVSMKRDSVVRLGSSDEVRTTTDLSKPAGEEIGLETVGPREFTLTVEARVDEETGSRDPNCDAMALITRLQSSLSQLSTKEIFCLAGLVVVEELAVVDLSEEVNGERISMAAMDIRMRATSSVTERTGYINAARVRSVPCNPSGPGDVEGVDFTVSGN